MTISFEKHLMLMQIVQDVENLRADIIGNANFAKGSIGVSPLTNIINTHIKANATAYLVRLDRIKAIYTNTGRKAKLNDALTSMGFSTQEALDIYTELRAATMMLIDSEVTTEEHVISVCDAITQVGGSNYIEPHDQLWG